MSLRVSLWHSLIITSIERVDIWLFHVHGGNSTDSKYHADFKQFISRNEYMNINYIIYKLHKNYKLDIRRYWHFLLLIRHLVSLFFFFNSSLHLLNRKKYNEIQWRYFIYKYETCLNKAHFLWLAFVIKTQYQVSISPSN